MENYFDLLKLPKKYALDLSELELRYKKLLNITHPDNVPMALKEVALSKSGIINEAYRVLRDPISRSIYLLRLHGVQYHEDGEVSTDLLEQQFVLRMRLEENLDNTVILTDLIKELDVKLTVFDEKIEELFSAGEWLNIVPVLKEMQFLIRTKSVAQSALNLN